MTSARWAKLSEKPLSAAAVVFLVVYSWQVLAHLKGSRTDDVAEAVTWVVWSAFVVDYVARLYLAQRRSFWFFRHLLDLAIVVLPLLRPLRLLRLVTLLSIFRRAAGTSLRGRVIVYAIGSTALLVYVAALAMLEAERDTAGAGIKTFGEAVWWACTTITTVGYGDYAPVSFTGRVVAVALMVGGVALLGTITATIASWLVQEVAEREEAVETATRDQVAELSRRIEQLTAVVSGLAGSGSRPAPVDSRDASAGALQPGEQSSVVAAADPQGARA